MKTKIIQTIWVAEDSYTHKIICTTPYFRDLIDILCAEDYLNAATYTTKEKTLKELYGENWLKILKSFNARKINNLISLNIKLRVADVIQVEREN